jgi:hypothetical protein
MSTRDSTLRIWIAGVAFTVVPAASGETQDLGPAFEEFLAPRTATDPEACRVTIALAPPPTRAVAPREPTPWGFSVRDGRVHLGRWTPDGKAVWWAESTPAFDEVALFVNPDEAPAVYGSCNRAWQAGVGLSMLVFRLLPRGGLVFHGCAAELPGSGAGVLCAGESGRGKSTLARLLHEAGAVVLTDERPAARRRPDGGFDLFGTPWPSAAGFARNRACRLRRIYFLEHGEADAIERLPASAALRRLLRVAAIPWQDAHFFDPGLATAEALLASVPFARLRFRPTPAVVDAIRRDAAAEPTDATVTPSATPPRAGEPAS